jgi:hypothetical protein
LIPGSVEACLIFAMITAESVMAVIKPLIWDNNK